MGETEDGEEMSTGDRSKITGVMTNVFFDLSRDRKDIWDFKIELRGNVNKKEQARFMRTMYARKPVVVSFSDEAGREAFGLRVHIELGADGNV